MDHKVDNHNIYNPSNLANSQTSDSEAEHVSLLMGDYRTRTTPLAIG